MGEPTRTQRLSEAEVKLSVGDWLESQGIRVFDEKANPARPHWGVFEVRNIDRGKRPDLLAYGTLSAAQVVRQGVYLAIEIKRGYKHQDVLDGFDALLEYFSDYLWGAEYWAENQPVAISAFAFATLFSQHGFLFAEEGKFDPRAIVKMF